MPRILFTVAYDGRPYEGWQSQPSKATVQDRLEYGLQELLGHPVRIHGSGRTDAGVHAVGQTFHIECDSLPSIPFDKWPEAFNTKLPNSIRVTEARLVDDDFHARFSATGKLYRYTICRARILSPFDDGLVWHNSRPIDMELMRQAAALVAGTHDFKAFSALRGNEPQPIPADHFVRSIFTSRIEEEGDYIRLSFHGNGFLYKMVRLLVGGIHSAAAGKLEMQDFERLLSSPNIDKSPFCAPASGLCLMNVFYKKA